jgi:hypothetical protein
MPTGTNTNQSSPETDNRQLTDTKLPHSCDRAVRLSLTINCSGPSSAKRGRFAASTCPITALPRTLPVPVFRASVFTRPQRLPQTPGEGYVGGACFGLHSRGCRGGWTFHLPSGKNSALSLSASNPDIGPQSNPKARAATMKYAACRELLRNAVSSITACLPAK